MTIRAGCAPLLAVALGAVAACAAAAPRLDWRHAFLVDASLQDVHFVARYESRDGKAHRLELWRHRREFLHRQTDHVLDLYVAGAHSAARYRLLDHRRRIAVDVTRVNLYRIGVFSSAWGLAHVLEKPGGRYSITPLADRPHIQPKVRAPCRWRGLHADDGKIDDLICWSKRWGLPLVILDGHAHRAIFEVTEVDATPLPAEQRRWPVVPVGYAIVDADDDIDPRRD